MNQRIISAWLIAFGIIICSTLALRAELGDENPTGSAGQFNGNVTTAGSYDPLTGNATRSITDIVVPGAVGHYPLAFTRMFNTRPIVPSVTDPFSKAGGWRHSYQWEIRPVILPYDSECQPLDFNVDVIYPDGRVVTFEPDAPGAESFHSFRPGISDFLQINVQLGSSLVTNLLLEDGGVVTFDQKSTSGPCHGNGPTVLTRIDFACNKITDPYGIATTINRNGDDTIATISDPTGRSLKLFYTTVSGKPAIWQVQEWPGASAMSRQVEYSYSNGELSDVTYFGDGSLTAHYTYQNSNAGGTNPRLIQTCNDSMYAGPMSKIRYTFASAWPHGFLLSENYYDGDPAHLNGPAVSTLAVLDANNRTETRGDSQSRTFTYSGGYLQSWTDFKIEPERAHMSQARTTASDPAGPLGFVKSVTDGRNNTTDLQRESSLGLVTAITYPLTPPDTDHAVRQIIYGGQSGCQDGNNTNVRYPCKQIDERGNPTEIVREAGTLRIQQLVSADTSTETFAYNSFGQMTTHRRRNGYYEHAHYDARGLPDIAWNPMASATPPSPNGSEAKIVTAYYDNAQHNHPWQDRIQSVTDRAVIPLTSSMSETATASPCRDAAW